MGVLLCGGSVSWGKFASALEEQSLSRLGLRAIIAHNFMRRPGTEKVIIHRPSSCSSIEVGL